MYELKQDLTLQFGKDHARISLNSQLEGCILLPKSCIQGLEAQFANYTSILPKSKPKSQDQLLLSLILLFGRLGTQNRLMNMF